MMQLISAIFSVVVLAGAIILPFVAFYMLLAGVAFETQVITLLWATVFAAKLRGS